MFWSIMKRETLDHLMSLRLSLTFFLTTVLMAVGALFFQAEYQRQLDDYSRRVNRSLMELAERASAPWPLFQVFSWNMQLIYRRPDPLGFIAEGHEKDLPDAFRVNAFRLEGPEYTLRRNPLLWPFDSLDWAFIVSLILSFAALVLTYDGFSGEKERGTLRLVMSYPVSRDILLLTKYMSAMIVLLLPLIVGVILSLLIIMSSGMVMLTADMWMRIGQAFGLSTGVISAFVMLGLLISARTKQPVTSLLVSLFAWVILVIVIPSGSSLLAKGLLKLPPREQVLEEAARAADEAFQSYNQRYPHPDNWIISGHWSPGEPLLRAFEIDEARGRVIEDYRNRMLAQVELGRTIARVSPSVLFVDALERVTGSGLVHYASFLQQARRYREAMKTFLNEAYPLDKVHPLDRAVTDPVLRQMTIEFDAIPKFEDRLPWGQEAISGIWWDAGVLVLINLGLFVIAYVAFRRYDVR